MSRISLHTRTRDTLRYRQKRRAWARGLDPATLVADLAALGVSVAADYVSNRGVQADGSLVQVWDDSRCATQDGAICTSADPTQTADNPDYATVFSSLSTLSVMIRTTSSSAGLGLQGYSLLDVRNTAYWGFYTSPAGALHFYAGDATSYTEAIAASAGIGVDTDKTFVFVLNGANVTVWVSALDPVTGEWGGAVSVPVTFDVTYNPWPDGLYPATGAGRFALTRLFAESGLFKVAGHRIWTSALTEAQVNAEIQSQVEVVPAAIAYRFSASNPTQSFGTLPGYDLADFNAVVCSGDWRYPALLSAGTNRPEFVNVSGVPMVRTDGIATWMRSTASYQLTNIVSPAAAAVIGTLPPATGVSQHMLHLTNPTQTALRLSRQANGNLLGNVSSSLTAGSNLAAPPTGMRARVASRQQNTNGTIRIRSSGAAEVTNTQTPQNTAAVSRLTFGASGANTPAQFTQQDAARVMALYGAALNNDTTRAAVYALLDAWAVRYAAGAV